MSSASVKENASVLPGAAELARRVVEEGYGDGAWHGPDLKAAVADVEETQAFWRPNPARHSIAEIVLHHAWYVRSVVEQLTGAAAAPFPVAGSDWFEVEAGGPVTWAAIRDTVAREHERLAAAARADVLAPGGTAPADPAERFGLLLGITCHAIYHAGQIQLLKVMGSGSGWRD